MRSASFCRFRPVWFVSRSFWPDQGKKRTQRWDWDKREAVSTNSNTWNPGLRINATVLVYSALITQWWEKITIYPEKSCILACPAFITPKEVGVNFYQKCERQPSQSKIYLQDMNLFAQKKQENLHYGPVQSSVNLAVFTSLIGKIQANNHTWPLEQ